MRHSNASTESSVLDFIDDFRVVDKTNKQTNESLATTACTTVQGNELDSELRLSDLSNVQTGK